MVFPLRPGGLMVRSPFLSITCLFTDIEGSTRLWEADPVGMRAALTRHDAILRAPRGSHGPPHRRGGGAGRGLLWAAAEPGGAAAGRRPRRSGTADRRGGARARRARGRVHVPRPGRAPDPRRGRAGPDLPAA